MGIGRKIPCPGSVRSGDCDDNDIRIHSPRVWYRDVDGDKYGNPNDTVMVCSAEPPLSYVSNGTDCDDGNPKVRSYIFWRDYDGDGFGDPGNPVNVCTPTPPPGYVTNFDDFYDYTIMYEDKDGDGHGSGKVVPYGAINNLDCNDNDNTIFPGAVEIADGKDNNCNGVIDKGFAKTWFQDKDGDGFGNPAVSTTTLIQPAGYVANNFDCNDNFLSYEDKDNDSYGINRLVPCGWTFRTGNCDDNDKRINTPRTWYRDRDEDRCGDPNNTIVLCKGDAPEGYTSNNTDCDDNNKFILACPTGTSIAKNTQETVFSDGMLHLSLRAFRTPLLKTPASSTLSQQRHRSASKFLR